MRTDSGLWHSKIASYEQQILDQKFELARLKKQLNIQDLKLNLLHEICRVSTDTFDIDCLLDSYMAMVMEVIKVATGSLLLIDQGSGLFSFVGKIGVRDDILRKKGKLTEREFAAMKEHPRVGAEIMAHIKQLADVIPGIRSHQERNDGMGYPDGLRNGDIPLAARVIAVADTFDAMTTDRPYRKRRSEEEAVEEIRRCSGGQFDETVTTAFLKAHESGEIERVMEGSSCASVRGRRG